MARNVALKHIKPVRKSTPRRAAQLHRDRHERARAQEKVEPEREEKRRHKTEPGEDERLPHDHAVDVAVADSRAP